MSYELTLAGPEGDEAVKRSSDSDGVYYKLGAEVDKALRRHPLAVSELGRPKRVDHVHLSIIDNTTSCAGWAGSRMDGITR